MIYFLKIAHQWEMVIGMQERYYLGLNYPALEVMMRTFCPVEKSKRAALYQDLRIMELAALEVLNKPKD